MNGRRERGGEGLEEVEVEVDLFGGGRGGGEGGSRRIKRGARDDGESRENKERDSRRNT